MRSVLLTGTAALLLAIGAAGAANAANPNVPTYSPYTLMDVPGSVPEAVRTDKPAYLAEQVYGPGMSEGRAAYVDDQSGYRRSAFPFNFLPWNW